MGANWRPIPDDVRGNTRRLTEELRAIKDRSGLSLTQIGARTHYSKASWERWFNGKRLVTEQALESLAVTVDEGARLLQPLLELAIRESESEGAQAEGAQAQTSPEPATVAEAAAPATGGEAAARAVARAETAGAEAVATAPAALAALADAVHPTPAQPAAPAPAAWWRRHLRTASIAACSALLGGAVGAYVASPAPAPSAQALGAHAPAAPASGRPSCGGIGCAGKDPQSTGCVKDEKTLITDHVGTIIIYLHYSARCHAAWGALTDAGPGDFATILTTTGDRQEALVHWGYDNYSMMVDASDPSIGLRVCGTPVKNKQDTVCTPDMSAPAGA